MKLLGLTTIGFLAICFNTNAQSICPQPNQQTLDINAVNALYSNNNNDWLCEPQGIGFYEVPIGSGINSIFSGSMWIAGLDSSEAMRVSITRPPQNCFSPGPLHTDVSGNFLSVQTNQTTSLHKINKWEVALHRFYFQLLQENIGIVPTVSPFEGGYEIPLSIQDWPAHVLMPDNTLHYLAPFIDSECCGGEPGIYEPELGDYPAFRFEDNAAMLNCDEFLHGDQALFWVMNDAYMLNELNFQTFGIEVQNIAFSFIASNSLNETTFLRRNVKNQTQNEYHEVYFGNFVDADLGNPSDDFFGNEASRGLAYYYNSNLQDLVHAAGLGYGSNPPAIGFSYVGGPLAEENDGIDNNWNGVVDEPGERHRIDYSVKITNNASDISGVPVAPEHYYNYLKGLWRNGDPVLVNDKGGFPVQTQMMYTVIPIPYL
jgi:hypothetical protein